MLFTNKRESESTSVVKYDDSKKIIQKNRTTTQTECKKKRTKNKIDVTKVRKHSNEGGFLLLDMM